MRAVAGATPSSVSRKYISTASPGCRQISRIRLGDGSNSRIRRSEGPGATFTKSRCRRLATKSATFRALATIPDAVFSAARVARFTAAPPSARVVPDQVKADDISQFLIQQLAERPSHRPDGHLTAISCTRFAKPGCARRRNASCSTRRSWGVSSTGCRHSCHHRQDPQIDAKFALPLAGTQGEYWWCRGCTR